LKRRTVARHSDEAVAERPDRAEVDQRLLEVGARDAVQIPPEVRELLVGPLLEPTPERGQEDVRGRDGAVVRLPLRGPGPIIPTTGGGPERPGLYLVSLDGKREFVTDDVDEVERWQAKRS